MSARSILADMVRASCLSHRFGEQVVLSDIDLHIEKGQTVAVMGASGGGKTTLLRCLSGLLPPTEGEVELFGTNIYGCSSKELHDVRQRVGVVFQGAALFDYLTVEDNVAFGLAREPAINKDEMDRVVAERLEMVGLEGTERKMPDELSGGMKKRVGVARALATDPELLFYDEPTSGLDPITAYSMDGLIADLARRTGVTSILVTHELKSVQRTADRVLFLADGKFLFDGTANDFSNTEIPRITEIIEKARLDKLSF